MNLSKSALPLLLLLISALFAEGCAVFSSPKVVKSTSGILKVSSSPLIWQRERSNYVATAAEAEKYVSRLKLDGLQDWRLPTPEEMLDFYYAFDFGSAKASKLGIKIEGYYWVTDEEGKTYAGTWCDAQICEISRSYITGHHGGYVRAVHR